MKSSIPTVLALASLGAPAALAYDSGSTSTTDLTVATDTALQVPEDGILMYRDVWVKTGATLTFLRNSRNTPVYLLAAGSVYVDGTIDVSGKAGTTISDWHITHLGGLGGPGGADGGSCRQHGQGNRPQSGMGPGATVAKVYDTTNSSAGAGGGASPIADGKNGKSGGGCPSCFGAGGKAFGSATQWTLHGGQGGAGACYGATPAAGGGGGGALTIAASLEITLGGQVLAQGGAAWSQSGAGGGGYLRLVADKITGEGLVSAAGDLTCNKDAFQPYGGCGGNGLIRVDANFVSGGFLAKAYPEAYYGFASESHPFQVTSPTPTLEIVKVDNTDVALPAYTAHALRAPNLRVAQAVPVTVVVKATNIPPGINIRVTMTTVQDTAAVVSSPTPLIGTLESSQATTTLTVPAGTRVGAFQAWLSDPLPVP